jgi:hypothetical protein
MIARLKTPEDPRPLAREECIDCTTQGQPAQGRRARGHSPGTRVGPHDSSPRSLRKPDAIRKRLAADYALDLCERFGVKTTTARTGKFRLVAAALFGDPDVDLQYHCMKAISQKPAKI